MAGFLKLIQKKKVSLCTTHDKALVYGDQGHTLQEMPLP